MRVIPHMHDFVSELSPEVQDAFRESTTTREVAAGEAVYRQGDDSDELFQLVHGAVKICNYSVDGREVVTGEFRAGDCFGEMGVLDQLPRVSHAIASTDARVRVLGLSGFNKLSARYPEFTHRLAVVLCRRLRYLYTLNEEASGLTLHQRLARTVHRLAYSSASRDAQRELYVSISQEELGQMLGVSRQSVNKGLKALAEDGAVELRYGRIYVRNLNALREQYEYLLGMEQITPGYQEEQG